MALTHPAAWDTLATSGAGVRPRVKVTAYQPANSAAAIDVPVTDGWVLKDAGQYPRTHAQVVTADTSLIPTSLSSQLQPNGAMLWIDYGYEDPTTGVVAWLRIHDGPITRVSADRPGGLITIESTDLSVVASSHINATDWTTSVSNLWGAAWQALLAATTLVTGYDTSGLTGSQLAITTPADLVWKAGDSSWTFIEYVADLLGAEAFVSKRTFYLRTVPQVGTPAYTFTVGESGTLTQYQSELQRAVNTVYLKYSGGITGTWTDTDPTSPTYVLGSYGRYALYETRTGTPSQATADAAAKEYARRARGQGRSYTLRSVPVPWLEPGDTVNVKVLDLATESHVVQSVTIPLGLDAMTITTRNPTYSGVM